MLAANSKLLLLLGREDNPRQHHTKFAGDSIGDW